MQKNIIKLNVATRRGTVLNGALFPSPVKADTLVIAITGIHGNFYSNPFYYDMGDALNAAGIDFAYAQTRNAFGVIRMRNALTKKEETIGSWNERFADTDEDIAAYLDEAERRGYRHRRHSARHRRDSMKAILYAFMAAVFYAINIPASKVLLRDVGPTTMAALLYLGAGIGIALLSLLNTHDRKASAPLTRQDMPFVVGMRKFSYSSRVYLLTHLVLRWLKYKSGAACSYSRFAALVRAIVWLKKDAMAILLSYGIAPPPDPGGVASGMPYLPGFEKMFLKSVG